MSYWSTESLALEDAINRRIWQDSVARQREVRAQHGHEQADVLQATAIPGGLPWVPDIVGSRWKSPDSCIVIGSAYSPFFSDDAGRARTMGLSAYKSADSVAAFQRHFMATVVAGDPSYYSPLGVLLAGIFEPEQVCLLDLCRACFVRTWDEMGGDKAVQADPDLYLAYVDANEDWTWQRLAESEAATIIVLGSIAEHAFLRLVVRRGLRASVPGGSAFSRSRARPVIQYASSMKLGDWLRRETAWRVSGEVEGRRRSWNVLPAYHPARHTQHDPFYSRTRRVLAKLQGMDLVESPGNTDLLDSPDPVAATTSQEERRPLERGGVLRRTYQPMGGRVLSQRDVMRRIWAEFGPDEDRVVREYAAAERRGDAQRKSNSYGLGEESYARRLLNDGLKKGWL